MKKLIALLVLAALLITLPVCAEGEGEQPVDTTAETIEETIEETTEVIPDEADNFDIKRIVLTNVDTGRTIYFGEYNQFVMHDYEDGTFSLTSERSSTFVQFTSYGVDYAYEEVMYTTIDCGNNRVQIQLPDGTLLADDDQGDGYGANLAFYAAGDNSPETGWYITSEEEQPIKILCLGDSITYGTNPDDTGMNISYRRDLSQYLVDYFGEVVFTGTQKTDGALVTDKNLLRHSGYPGYAIEAVYGESIPGISDLTYSMMYKYSPDVVVLMIGTNDCANIPIMNETELENLVYRWENLVRNIESMLPEDGTIICCTIPECENIGDKDVKYNDAITEKATALMEEGLKISIADVYSEFDGHSEYLSSDGTHLSNEGNSAVAKCICRVIASLYGPNGVKGEGQEITFEEAVTETVESSQVVMEETEPEAEPYDFDPQIDYTIPIIFGALALFMIAAIIVLLIIKKKRK